MVESNPIRGLPWGRGLNIAYEAVDRHASGPSGDRTAIRWLSPSGGGRELSYGELAERTSRFANVLRSLGTGPGERVGILLPRLPEYHVSLLGTLKCGAVACPLSLDFDGEFLSRCVQRGWIRVLVTTSALYAERIAPYRARLKDLTRVLLVGEDGMLPWGELPRGGHDLHAMFRRVPAEFTIPVTDSEDPALLCFSRGASGRPVGRLYLHRMVVQQHAAGGEALDLLPGDAYWCTLDPTTPTGVCNAVITPLTCGAKVLVSEDRLWPLNVLNLLRRESVDVWYTTPETLTAMRQAGVGLTSASHPPSLRVVAAAGMPPDPLEHVHANEIFGLPVRESWGQAETGGIVIANPGTGPARAGSVGRPLPGVEAAVVRRRLDGKVDILPPHAEGELAIRAGWPAMFKTYVGEAPRYKARFSDGWYLSGDRAKQDADGWFWLVERADAASQELGARELLDQGLMNLRAQVAEPLMPAQVRRTSL